MKKLVFSTAALFLLVLSQACDSEEFVSAKMWIQNAELEKAEEFFLKAIEVEPDNAEIPFRLARDVYAPQHRWAEMSNMLSEAVQRNPEQLMSGNTIEDLSLNLRQMNWSKEYGRAATLYNTVLEETGGETPSEEQATILRQAIDIFKDAILIKPDQGETYQSLVFSYRQLSDLDGERQAISDALERDPNNGIVLLISGQNAYTESRYDDAIALLERANNALPENIDVLNLLTSVYLQVGDSKSALSTLERVRDNAPRDPDVFFNLGAVYSNVGNELLTAGQDIYLNAIGQDEKPIDDLKLALEKFQQAQEAYSEALYFMDNVLAINPDDEPADQAIRDIQSRKKSLDTLQRGTEAMVE